MLNKVKDVAEISSGLVVSRKKAIHRSELLKEYKQLNLRAINKNGFLELNELENFLAKEIIDKNYLTQEGDIIVRLTDPFTAVYITKKYEDFVVSSNFCIIRCKKEYDSKFLAYYLNSDKTKKILYSDTKGSIIKNISVESISKINVPTLDFDKQVIFGKLFVAQTQKIILLDKIKKLEEKRKKAIFEQLDRTE